MQKVPWEHVSLVCKIGQDSDCCRYLVNTMGWLCAKGSVLGKRLDERVMQEEMTAIGDNCAGYGKEEVHGV